MLGSDTGDDSGRAGGVRGALRALFRRPSLSLSSRITLLGFAGTLLTSLAVTWISTHSTHAFLSERIHQEFPATLSGARDRLQLWYSQRRLDIDTLSRSTTLVENLARSRRVPAELPSLPEQEIRQYLSYVLESFEQYEALFVLGPGGRLRLWVGHRIELPERIRVQLARVADSRVGDAFPLAGRRFQVASAPIVAAPDRRLGSLHALFRIDAVERLLRAEDGSAERIFLVGRDGRYLTDSRDRSVGEAYTRPLPEPGEAAVVENYRNEAGESVVGSALRFDQFEWAIVVEEPYAEAFAPVLRVLWRVLAINLAIVTLFGLIAFQVASSIARPIRALSEGVRRVGEGESDVVIMDASTPDEIGLLTRTFNKMTARLHRDGLELERTRNEIETANARLRAQNQELQRVNKALEELSTTDGLTKLYNHRYFQDQLTREIKRAERTGEELSLILVDIDNFKRLNDEYGHSAGDVVLRSIADVMQENVRDIDLLARYGGEEFALLATRTGLRGAAGLAEKIRVAVGEATIPIEFEDEIVRLRTTVSIGVARFRGDRRAFFNDADRALYRAKASGKDCVVAESG